jgi:anti-sigma B factor antagonist
VTELSVSVEDGADGAVIVRLSGEADITTVPALAEALSSPAAGSPALLIVDASGLTFIDSAALHVLVRAHRRLRSDGRSLALVRPSPTVMRILQLSGLDRVIAVYASPADAA